RRPDRAPRGAHPHQAGRRADPVADRAGPGPRRGGGGLDEGEPRRWVVQPDARRVPRPVMARQSSHLPLFLGALPDSGDRVELAGEDGAHAVRVRRIRVGEQIRIADGQGRYADCEVTELAARSLTARIVDRGAEPVRTPRLVVVQALAKADRATLAVELLTE